MDAIGLVLDEDNDLYFSIDQPTGDWYWIENKANLQITNTMTDLITSQVRF
jgi:hypothetical protein